MTCSLIVHAVEVHSVMLMMLRQHPVGSGEEIGLLLERLCVAARSWILSGWDGPIDHVKNNFNSNDGRDWSKILELEV
jgi:hypothetical protein